MIFQYKAKDPMNRVLTGEIEAQDIDHAKRELIGRALTPLYLRPVQAGTARQTAPQLIVPAEDEGTPAQSSGGLGWGGAIFLLIYILLQIFGML